MCRYLSSNPIAAGVGQHGKIVKQPQNGSAVAELSREQQQAFPQLVHGHVGVWLPGESSSDQLRSITDRPDLGGQTEDTPGNPRNMLGVKECFSKQDLTLKPVLKLSFVVTLEQLFFVDVVTAHE